MRATAFAPFMDASCKFASMLLLLFTACAGNAYADDRDALTAKIIATGPLPCAQEALSLMSAQLERMEPDLVLQGVRQSMNLGEKWTNGDMRYEQARAVVATTFSTDQASNGPFFAFSTTAVLNKALGPLSPDDLQYLAKFFEKPEGRLFWEESIDGAICNGWLKTISRAPYPALDGENLQRWEKATTALKGAHDRFVRKLNALPKASQSAYYEGAEKITAPIQQAPLQLINERNAELGVRLGQILKPKMKEINAIVEAFKGPQS
jgi:hypothetical protein